MSSRAQFVLALVLDVLGTAGVLLIGTREWQTVVTDRGARFVDDTLQVTGRTVDSAPTAMALVALAGAVAVIATRGVARRVVGAVIALAGVGIVWRAVAAMSALSASRASELVRERHPSVTPTTGPRVATHGVWALLTVGCAVLVIIAGVVIAVRGGRWRSMSTRYESPAVQADPEAIAARRARADAAMWTALDRGDDPTARDPRDTE